MNEERLYFLERKRKLQNFATAFHLRANWHEPDEQDVTAIVTGRVLDNAWGNNTPPLYQHTYREELVVHLSVGAEHKLSINLATLLAIACMEA